MRAWEVHRHGSIESAVRQVDRDRPSPGPGQLRVRVTTAGIGLPDALMVAGTYPLTPPLPFVSGQEVCGIVEAVGPGTAASVGTRVVGVTDFMTGRGGFAESAIIDAANVYDAPDFVSDADAATLRIGFSTAWIGLVRRARVLDGETLLVLGASGGSGAAAVQLGRALGATVIAVAHGSDKAALCRKLGAAVTIDRARHDVRTAVMAASDGKGVDVIYDPVGGAPAATAARTLAYGGRLLAVGFASGSWAEVPTASLVQRNAALVGVYAGGLSRTANEADHAELLKLARRGHIGGFTTITDFDDLPAALTRVGAGQAVGKYALRVS